MACLPSTGVAAASSASATLSAALNSAATAARLGAESTRAMLARRGRAAYVGEHARGVEDPGASAIAMFFAASSYKSIPA